MDVLGQIGAGENLADSVVANVGNLRQTFE
jgi:hypothetical protein